MHSESHCGTSAGPETVLSERRGVPPRARAAERQSGARPPPPPPSPAGVWLPCALPAPHPPHTRTASHTVLFTRQRPVGMRPTEDGTSAGAKRGAQMLMKPVIRRARSVGTVRRAVSLPQAAASRRS